MKWYISYDTAKDVEVDMWTPFTWANHILADAIENWLGEVEVRLGIDE